MDELVLVKLGGSLITDKRGEAQARRDVIRRLAAELAEARPQLCQKIVLGHGSGSFGHVAAARYGLGRDTVIDGSQGPLRGVSATQDQAARLHRIVIDTLLTAGVETFSVSPSSAFIARAGRLVAGEVEPLLRCLSLGLIPVVYGDVVSDRLSGASIVSTEEVFRYLIGRFGHRGLRVRRLLWLGETAGLYDRSGRTITRVDSGNYRRVLAAVEAPAGTDVTGGMLLRVQTARALARRGIESWLVDGTVPGSLSAALAGRDEFPGTRFVADS